MSYKFEGTAKWVGGKADDINKYYTLGKMLGQPGNFGKAQAAVHKETGKEYAVKIISKAVFKYRKETLDHFRTEIDIMKQMDHPNIIKFYEAFETDTEIFFVLDFCKGGELFDRISRVIATKERYSEKDAAKILRQAVQAISYCHKQNVAHLDIKPDNFLFADESEDADLKVIDFGLSRHVKARVFLSGNRGTYMYMAPEVLSGKYTLHADMWSIAVVMFVMLFGFPPFFGDDYQVKKKIKQGFTNEVKAGFGAWYPKGRPCSDSARDLMTHLFVNDDVKRFSAEEALNHPWLKGETASDQPIAASVLGDLSKWANNFKFKHAVCQVLENVLSDAELKQLENTFKALDKNGDGAITANELKEALQQSIKEAEAAGGESKEQDMLSALMKIADVDGDGVLSYSELLSVATTRKMLAKEDRIYQAFHKFDEDGDGQLSAQEIKKAIPSMSDEDVKEMMDKLDTNGDGLVDYDEFLEMWVEGGLK